MGLTALLLLLLLALPIGLAIRIVPESHRFIVVRLGRFHSVLMPGLRCVLPGLDHVVRVDLDRDLPNWRSLPEPELQSQLRKLALSGRLNEPIS